MSEEVAAFKLVLGMGLPEASRQWVLNRISSNPQNSLKNVQGPQTPSSVLQGLQAAKSKNSNPSILLEVKSSLNELFAQQIQDVDLTKEGDQHELSELSELNVSQISQNGQKSTPRGGNVNKQKMKQVGRQLYQPTGQKRMLPSHLGNDGNKRFKVKQEEAAQSNKVSELKRNLKGMNIELKIQPPAPKPTGLSFSNISEIKNLLKKEPALQSKPTSNQVASTFPKRQNPVQLSRVSSNQLSQPMVTRIHNCLLCRFRSTLKNCQKIFFAKILQYFFILVSLQRC